MEIEDDVELKHEEMAERLAILNNCLKVSEEVQQKPISTKFKQMISKNEIEGSQQDFEKEEFPAWIFLTNFRILLILLKGNGRYSEKSVYYDQCKHFVVAAITEKLSLIKYLQNNQIRYNIFVELLSNQDMKLINEFFMKTQSSESNNIDFSEQQPQAKEEKIKKSIIESDSKLRALFDLVVEKKKILTSDQFWESHDGYQALLKYKNRDEEKIKRDYIQSEIPLVNIEAQLDATIEVLDEKQARFDTFREEIYDPNGLIEIQNQKSFQSYKQEVYFSGKIDKIIQKMTTQTSKNLHKNAGDRKQSNANEFDENHINGSIEYEEVSLSLNEKPINQKKVKIEMKKAEYVAKIAQNSSIDHQEKLKGFLQNIKKAASNGNVQKSLSIDKATIILSQFKEKQKEAIGKSRDSWTEAISNLYKLKASSVASNDIPAEKRLFEEYSDKFYHLREIIRWLYKEKRMGDAARPEIIDKLKTELEYIRNSLADITPNQNLDKRLKELQNERIKDLKTSFLFK